jgi:hypothetical protein
VVFPASAGMNRYLCDFELGRGSVPRERGDEPSMPSRLP